MRALGLVLLLFGLVTLVLHFTETRVEALDWMGNWGDNAAWGIRIGAVVLGLILLTAGKKQGGPPKK
jgi:hypothetical protein